MLFPPQEHHGERWLHRDKLFELSGFAAKVESHQRQLVDRSSPT